MAGPQATDNRPRDKGADSELPDWQPKEKAIKLPQERGTLEPAWVASVRKKGRGPKDPGVAAPLASAGCRGSRVRYASCVALLDRPVEDMVWPLTECSSQVSGKGICPLVS